MLDQHDLAELALAELLDDLEVVLVEGQGLLNAVGIVIGVRFF